MSNEESNPVDLPSNLSSLMRDYIISLVQENDTSSVMGIPIAENVMVVMVLPWSVPVTVSNTINFTTTPPVVWMGRLRKEPVHIKLMTSRGIDWLSASMDECIFESMRNFEAVSDGKSLEYKPSAVNYGVSDVPAPLTYYERGCPSSLTALDMWYLKIRSISSDAITDPLLTIHEQVVANTRNLSMNDRVRTHSNMVKSALGENLAL